MQKNNFDKSVPLSGLVSWGGAFALSLLGAWLLTGCAGSPEKIVFSDDPAVASKPSTDALPPVPAVQKLTPAEELQVDAVVYGYLLQRDFWATHEYTAVFLQGDDDEVAALQKQFPNHYPPIKASNRALLQPNRTPVDKDTGKPAMVLSVETADPAGNTVVAVGRWYAGGAMAGFYQFYLKKVDGNWVLDSVK